MSGPCLPRRSRGWQKIYDAPNGTDFGRRAFVGRAPLRGVALTASDFLFTWEGYQPLPFSFPEHVVDDLPVCPVNLLEVDGYVYESDGRAVAVPEG